REPSRSGVDWGMPLMANSGERPRSVSPEPESFCRVGEKEGMRVATASTTEPLMAACWARLSISMTSMVSGRALDGRADRAADTTMASAAKASTSVACAAGAETQAAPASKYEILRRIMILNPSVLGAVSSLNTLHLQLILNK